MISFLVQVLAYFFHARFNAGASALILNDEGHVFLVKHRFWSHQSWGMPGGFIHGQETLQQGISREVLEETGLRVKVGRLVEVWSDERWKIEAVYASKVVGGKLKLDSTELLDSGYWPLDALPQPLYSKQQELLSKLAANGGIGNDGSD